MELIQQNYSSNNFTVASKSPPSSSHASNTVGVPQLNPRVGHEYQVEVPPIIKRSEQLRLLMNPAESEAGHDNSLSFAIGSLPIPVTWILNEVVNSGHEEWEYLGGDGEDLKPISFQSAMLGDSHSGQLRKSKNYALVPGTKGNSWNETDAKSFLLGLYVFGKNFIQIKRFLENKRMGEILAFYYGEFYKSDDYRRWSDCRKIKGKKSIIGQKLFTGQRQYVLLSRLIPHVSEESKDILRQISKSYTEGRASLEEYISSLKSTVGLGVLVEAVGIGKEKEDLTSLAVEPKRKRRVFPMRTSKGWSSLGPSGIINFLTGGFRLSKTKSNDLFWEAVWPRLVARGWHAEHPANQGYVSPKDYLVFLIPGVKKFSRSKLVKGDQYFDSVSDVLNKVAAEPNLLDLEEKVKVGSSNDEEPEMGLNKDDQSAHRPNCYLNPQASTYSTDDHIEFMVIDTSLVPGGKSSDLREFKLAHVNSAGKVEVNAAADIPHKGAKHARNIRRNWDMSDNIDQKLSDMLCERKLLKVRGLKYLPVRVEDASKMTGLLRESKRSSCDDSPSVVEANILTYDNKNISNTNDRNNAKKVMGNLKSQKTSVSNDNQLKRTTKHQFSWKTRSSHSNHAVLPIKRRTLAACIKSETSNIVEDSSGGLRSEKNASSHENIGDPVSCENASLIPSSTEKSLEENKEESILKEICQGNEGRTSVSHDKVEQCKSQSSGTFKIPQVPSKSENGEMMAMVEEDGQSIKANGPCLSSDTQAIGKEPLRTSSDVGSMEQQPNANSRRQSTRNRPLTVRVLESLANEFLHGGPKRQKRKHIETHQDAISVCRRARTKGKKMARVHSSESSDHGTTVLAEEKHLNGDCTVN